MDKRRKEFRDEQLIISSRSYIFFSCIVPSLIYHPLICIFKTMKKSTIICVLIAIAISVNLELPKMVKTNYQGKAKSGLNVTIGEKFSLPLPHFDTPWENRHFQVYEVP